MNKTSSIKTLLKVMTTIPTSVLIMIVLGVIYTMMMGFWGLGLDTFTQDFGVMLGSICLVVTAYVYWTLIDKKHFSAIGIISPWRAGIANLLWGSLLGITLVSLGVALLFLLGFASWRGLVIAGNPALAWGIGVLTFAMVAVGEEIFSRGYAVKTLMPHFGVNGSILLSALLFSALHIANPYVSWLPMLNVFLMGLLLGWTFWRTGSLWFSIGLHWTWNIAQGIIFSLRVSGLETPGIMHVAVDGPTIITGGNFGIEGGIIVTGLILIGFLAVEMYSRRLSLGRVAASFGE
ncbi:MAG: type II CAAX endopeptidase family protein [bacterium]|nr:type II CAAX endopeptidase family protein [bacterium]